MKDNPFKGSLTKWWAVDKSNIKYHMKTLVTAQQLKERAMPQQTWAEKQEPRTWSGASRVAVSWRRTWVGIEGHGSRTVDQGPNVKVRTVVTSGRHRETKRGRDHESFCSVSRGASKERQWPIDGNHGSRCRLELLSRRSGGVNHEPSDESRRPIDN